MRQKITYFLFLILGSIAASAQFTAGNEGFHIQSTTPVTLDGLTLIPTADVTIDNRTLSTSALPITGIPTGSIKRVYTFDTPINFSGVVGIFYRPGGLEDELNGNSQANLEISYSSTGGGSFQVTSGSTSVPADNYVFNTLAGEDLSSVTATNANNALPVSLVEFKVKKEGQTALLYWVTASELNSNSFDVQRSQDTKNWKTLTHVDARGESRSKRDYSCTDPDPLLAGSNFYRLKMIDNDGSFAYSSIREVSFTAPANATLYPNPTAEKLIIKVDDWSKVMSVQITNLQGFVVYDSKNNKKVNASSSEIDMKFLPSGAYIVRINRVGGDYHALKVIRQ